MNIICFSHLRWNFVYQRPQHLFTRFAKHYTIYFVEEPVLHESDDSYSIAIAKENIFVVTPYLNNTNSNVNPVARQAGFIKQINKRAAD